jgi:hypothetical protein
LTTYRVLKDHRGPRIETLERPQTTPLPPGLDPPPQITVPQTLRSPDPLVGATKSALDTRHPDQFGRVRAHDCPLAVDVFPDSIPRALRLMNAVVREARRLGFELRRPAGGGHVQLVIEGEPVAFGIHEKAVQFTVPKADRRYGWDSGVRYRSSGALALGVGERYATKYRRFWRDIKASRLEDRIGEFFVGAYREALHQKEERERREAYWKEQERQREVERLRAEQEAREHARRERLEAQAERWTQSRQVSAFIDAVEARAAEQWLSEEAETELAAWLYWAREHAARLDPLSRGLPHDEPDPPPPRAAHRLLR